VLFRDSPILRTIINVLVAAFGSSPRRKVNREELERTIGRPWTLAALSLPYLLVAVWLGVWLYVKITDPESAPTSIPLPFIDGWK